MEESELTRKAIEELMNEMDEYKGKEVMPAERKKNPLGRPNKHFLGRTINSMLTHNKRQSDRNLQRCERKLRELDEKQKKNKLKKYRKANHGKLENLHEIISVESCDGAYKSKTSKNLTKKKIRKKHRRSPSSLSTSSTQTESSNSSKSSSESNHRKKRKHKKESNGREYEQQVYSDYVNDNATEYYVDHNMAYAAMAYSQINHMMQQQQIFHQQFLKKELEESAEISSALSISCHSSISCLSSPESSINISLNSSSAEEDENGILTFKLSSDDDDENASKIPEAVNLKSATVNGNEVLFVDSEEIEKDSVHSHISLESNDSQKVAFEERNEIYVISSSCSDSELEIVETIAENINEVVNTN